MASELLKNRALIQRLKEPEVSRVKFNLASTGFEELFTLPEPKPQELLDIQEDNRKGRLLESLNKIGGRLEDSSLDFIRRQNFSNGLGANISKYKSKGKQLGYNVRSRKEGIEKTFSKYQYDGSLEKALEAAKKYREEILGNYITNEQYLELRNQHKEKSAKEFAEYIKKETNFKPRRGEKFTREGVKTRDREVNFETTRVKTKRTLAPEIEEEVYQKYLKAVKEGKREGTIIGLGREYLPGLTRSQQEKTISRILKEKGVDLSPFKKEGTGEKAATQVARRERLSTAKKQAGSSAGQLSDEIILDIKAMNDKVKNMSLEDIAANKKYINSMRINATMDNLSKGVIPFDKYKDLTDLELAEKIKDRADANKFFDVEHISSVKGQKRNLYYPNNIQMAPGQFGSLMDNFKRIADEQPNNPVLSKVDEVLSDYNLTVRNPETKVRLGNKSVIEVSEGTSNIVKSNFDALNTPFEKQTITKAAEPRKNIKKIIASIGCPGKAMGGRIGFQDGTTCFLKGQKAINMGNIKSGAQARNFAKFFNSAYKLGRGVLKFGVIPEALFVGGETLVRMGMGDTLDEAFLRATEFFRPGDQTAEADKRQIERLMGPENAKYMLNLRNFQKAQQELKNVIGAQQADLALAGKEFDEMSSGETQTDVIEKYKPEIAQKEKAVLDATISQPETLYARSLEDEFEDIKGVKRGKIGRQKRQELNIVDPEDPETESLVTPEITQAELNRGIVGQQPTIAEDIFGDFSRATKTSPQQVLDFMRAQEQTAAKADKAVENVRREQFEKAYEDSALREALLGFNIPQPVDLENYEPSDRFEDFQMNRGIYSQGGRIGYSSGSDGTALAIEASLEAFQRYLKAGGKLSYKDFIAVGGEGVSKFFNSGGRVGFKDGPKNPGRRTFMKLAAGIASIPILGKFFKPAVPLVKKLANSNTVMPDWFPNFVDKFVGRSIGKKIDADLMEYTNPDLPNIKLTRKDDGSLLVEGTNEHNQAYNITYEPPGYELIDETTGKAIRTKGEFEAVEGRHVAMGPDDYDTDAFYAEDLDELFTSDIADMEKYTTGNVTDTAKDAFGRDTGLKKGMYDSDMAQGRAENQADILRDEGLDEID